MEQAVGVAHLDDLLGEHLEHVGKHLEQAPFTYTHRAETTLEEGAHLALHVNQHDGEDGIKRNDDQSHQYAFNEHGAPLRHHGGEQAMQPLRYYAKVEHKFCCLDI
ncbi:unknown [Prevotella sp. CAG:617]|nr:unknown [Prevotella sp. CAG:617]